MAPKGRSGKLKSTALAVVKGGLEDFLKTSELPPYREMAPGSRDDVQIAKHVQLLPKIPSGMPQSQLKKILRGIAVDREGEWHLSAETDQWSEQMAKRLRMMVRDYNQVILKYSSRDRAQWPEWMKEIVPDPTAGAPAAASGAAPAAAAADAIADAGGDAEEPQGDEEETEAQEETDEEGAAEEATSAPTAVMKKPSMATRTAFTYKWNQELQDQRC